MAYPGKPKYSPLSSRDPEYAGEQEGCIKSLSRTQVRLSLALQIVTLAISALLLARSVFPTDRVSSEPVSNLPKGMNRVNPTTARQSKPCGTTAETARQNGCVFDLLTFSWLAPECYDEELSAEFLEVASEPFFYDEEAQRPVQDYETLSDIPLGEISWTTRKYHIFHCSFGWRMMHRSLERGTILESGLAGYHHTEHCTGALMNTSIPLDKIITKVEIDFPDC